MKWVDTFIRYFFYFLVLAWFRDISDKLVDIIKLLRGVS